MSASVPIAPPFREPTSVSHSRTEALTFAELYQQYARYVWRLVFRLGVATNDVEDVCQEVFTVVHRKLPGFEQRSSLKTWLYGIAYRCASDYRRRAHRKREVLEDDMTETLPGEPLQEQHVDVKRAQALMARALESLDEAKRATFVLYEFEELDMTEISHIMQCPAQTGYSRLNAARKHIEREVSRMHMERRT